MSDDLAAVFRREAGRCTASLIRVLGDIDLAEEAVADAFTVAVARWPVTGVPPNPGAWITVTARNKAIDRLRREGTRNERHAAAARLHGDHAGGALPGTVAAAEGADVLVQLDALGQVVTDDRLRLMFLCCHPALAPEAQVALTLRLLGGLETPEIARALLVSDTTMAQRIVRAKRKLRDNHVAYRIPRPADLADRLHAVLAVISLIFTEGHRATSGDELHRTDLSAEAIRLGRVLVELMPDEPEALGLLALMVLTDARRAARLTPGGDLVRLADQDRGLWDRDLIDEGHAMVRTCLERNQPGAFQLQAAIAAVHADARTAAATDWAQIVALYDHLLALQPTPVVAVNRAVAVGELEGPEAGLAALAAVEADAADAGPRAVERLQSYPPYLATRAGLLLRAGRDPEAAEAFDRATELTTNPAERRFLKAERAKISTPRPPSRR